MQPTEADIPGIAAVFTDAFAEKRGPCCGRANSLQANDRAYRACFHKHKGKWSRCRIAVAKDKESGEHAGQREVLGVIQLTICGDMGELMFNPAMRHVCSSNECYLEKIGCAQPGLGIGSKLMAWAHDYAKNEAKCNRMTLEVMAANRAKQLYARQGYVAQCNYDPCDLLIGGVFIFLCLGCKYCRVVKMEKPL